MSASRRSRRRLARARIEAAWAQAEHAPPRFVGMVAPGLEAWKAGPALFLLPALPDGAPPELLNALDRRRRATLTGQCDCGARRRIVAAGRTARADMAHEPECPADNDSVRALVAAWRKRAA